MRSVSKFEIRNSKLPLPLYLLLGPEEYLKEERLTQLEESLISPSERTMNRDVFWGENLAPGALHQALETIPCMSERRVVILRRCEDLEAENVLVIKRWLAKGASSTTLILLSREEKLGRELMEAAEAAWGRVLPFRERSFEEASRWIQEYAQKLERKLSAEAAHFIVGETGKDIMRLVSEMDKLSLAGDEAEIPLEMAQRIIGHLHTSRLPALAEASTLGRPDCMDRFQEAIEAREVPVHVVAYIIGHMRRLLRARLLQRTQLVENLRMLLWADEALKTSQMPAEAVLSLLGLGFCRGEKRLELARPS